MIDARNAHMQAKNQIQKIARELGEDDFEIMEFGPSSDNSFPMNVRVRNVEVWASAAASIEGLGLQPEVLAAYSWGRRLKYQVEVHVPDGWQLS